MNITIREASDKDFESIWDIFQTVIKTGDTYAFSPSTNKQTAYVSWMPPDKNTYVAVLNNQIIGTYFIKPNQPGLGSHVGNAAYMVHPEKHSHGIGKAMAEHSLAEAKKLGYLAIQFNFVISTNKPAVALWKKMGFQIIGISPKAFKHTQEGLIDAYIMHRFID